jgi:hypothetical protein
LGKCDGVLRVGGSSAGADLMVEVARKNRLLVFKKIDEIPPAELEENEKNRRL